MSRKVEQILLPYYDLYMSYEASIKLNVGKLCNELTNIYGVITYFDSSKENLKNDDYLFNSREALIRSKMVVCCITKSYSKSKSCKNEITFAYTSDKHILALLFDKLTSQELSTVLFNIPDVTICNLYSDKNLFKTFAGPLFDQILLYISDTIGRSLRKSETKSYSNFLNDVINMTDKNDQTSCVKVRRSLSITTNFLQDSETALEAVSSSLIPTSTINHLHVEELLGSVINEEDYDKELVETDVIIDPNLVKIKNIKSSSFVKVIYGFNRIVYVKQRGQFIVTSSYNKQILAIEPSGTLADKTNPGGLLKQPWSLCTNSRGEIFIGDNGVKCIFVFDANLRLITTLGKGEIFGFHDLAIDEYADDEEIYVASLYDSIVTGIDYNTNKIKKKVFVSTPAYIRLNEEFLYILSASDLIYIIKKKTLEVHKSIKINKVKYLSGLHIFNDMELFTTGFDVDETNGKTKDVYMLLMKIEGNNLTVKRLNLGVTQVNDFLLIKNKMFIISDTHFDVVECKDFYL